MRAKRTQGLTVANSVARGSASPTGGPASPRPARGRAFTGRPRRCPAIHHSDQGFQHAATDYVALLQAHHITISMAEVGQPTQNGYAERLIRTIKEEEVDLSEYRDYHDACQQIGRFLEDVYTHKRIHSSLGYLTPSEFESQWFSQQAMLEVAQ